MRLCCNVIVGRTFAAGARQQNLIDLLFQGSNLVYEFGIFLSWNRLPEILSTEIWVSKIELEEDVTVAPIILRLSFLSNFGGVGDHFA